MNFHSENIKELRERLGWTQQQLADELGVNRNTINRWEMGKRSPGQSMRSKLDDLVNGINFDTKDDTTKIDTSQEIDTRMVSNENDTSGFDTKIDTKSETGIKTDDEMVSNGIKNSDIDTKIDTRMVSNENDTSGFDTKIDTKSETGIKTDDEMVSNGIKNSDIDTKIDTRMVSNENDTSDFDTSDFDTSDFDTKNGIKPDDEKENVSKNDTKNVSSQDVSSNPSVVNQEASTPDSNVTDENVTGKSDTHDQNVTGKNENVTSDSDRVTGDRPSKFAPNYVTSVLELLHGDSDGIIEVRIFPNERYLKINGHREYVGKTVSGYYTDLTKIAQDVKAFDGKGNIYFTLNPVNPDLLARAANRLKYSVETTTKDNDILSDRWLPIDIDPVRPKDVSSTDEELKLALKTQAEIVTWLDKFSIPTITGMSGNGAHILIPLIGYPNTQETRQAKEQFIHFLSLKFSDDKVSVDSTVFNMARIWKLYGTLAVKGDNIPERPHRRAWLSIPEQMPEPIDLYAMLPDILPACDALHDAFYQEESEPSAEGEQRARTAVKRERPKSQVSISDQTGVPITSGADDHSAGDRRFFTVDNPAVSNFPELIEKAKNAKNGAKFTALWEGLTDGYDSQSEADLALCCLLAFWTGGDRDRIDRLFRQSGLYREDKWGGREDYRERTINAALEQTTEFYDPSIKAVTGRFLSSDNHSARSLPHGRGKNTAQEVNLFEKKKTKEDFSPYFKKDTFIPKLLADDILSDNRFINVKGLLYRYENGVYRDDGEQFIAAESQNKLGNESRQNRISETVYYIKVDSYTEPERVNPTDKGHLINLQNGLYDWIEGKLLPHDPKHLSTIRIPIEYNPEATCPTVDYFLESTLPKDCIPIAEELFGYVLIPYVRFEKAFMFTGNGANGKSTFLTLLEKFVGSDNVSKIPLQELDEHRFKRADLFGKLVNLFADLDARDVQSSTYFKTIVSGDSIDAERKHQDPFFFRPFARLAFSANEIPRSPDNSYAYFRRWVIVPFPHRFEGRDADKSLADKMIEPKELSGLLNHALKGLNRLFEQEEFSASTTIKASLEDYKKQNDTVAAFVNDCCIFDSNVEVERGELYTAYSQYCEDEGYKAISRHACYGRIRAYSQVAEKGDGKKRYFTGIVSAGVAVSNFPQKQS